MKMVRYAVILLPVILASCPSPSGSSGPVYVTESRSFELVNDGKEKYLAIINLSPRQGDLRFEFPASARSLAGTGSRTLAPARGRSAFSPNNEAIFKDLKAASQFNANPPPVSSAPRRLLRAGVTRAVGDTKDFWVQNAQRTFIERPATLQAQGTDCNIWVVNSNYNDSSSSAADNAITTAQADALAAMFDAIYPLEVKLLGGYEYGGDPADTATRGGRDGDEKIQILVYDIDEDYSLAQTGGVLGYFWGKDFYTDAELDRYKETKGLRSNNAEIFYIDAHFLDSRPNSIYSTLIHEFQHMINFNQKSIKRNLISETWYNEMLSMLAEDVIGPKVGIPSISGPIGERIPLFLDCYDLVGVDEWLEGEDAILSYSTVYAFGAYLIRNYGGPVLIHKMLTDNTANHNSVTQALRNFDGSLSFEKALEQYVEALLYSTTKGGTAGKLSFDKSVSSSIIGETYTAAAFDIWNVWSKWHDEFDRPAHQGPVIFDHLPDQPVDFLMQYPAAAHSIRLFKIPHTLTGTWEITLTRPEHVSIKLDVLGY